MSSKVVSIPDMSSASTMPTHDFTRSFKHEVVQSSFAVMRPAWVRNFVENRAEGSRSSRLHRDAKSKGREDEVRSFSSLRYVMSCIREGSVSSCEGREFMRLVFVSIIRRVLSCVAAGRGKVASGSMECSWPLLGSTSTWRVGAWFSGERPGSSIINDWEGDADLRCFFDLGVVGVESEGRFCVVCRSDGRRIISSYTCTSSISFKVTEGEDLFTMMPTTT